MKDRAFYILAITILFAIVALVILGYMEKHHPGLIDRVLGLN